MDTQIFNQGLSVMAASAYIIIAAIQDDGARATMTAVNSRWNASPAELEAALGELSAKNIIERHPGPQGEAPIYIANPASMWTAGLRAGATDASHPFRS